MKVTKVGGVTLTVEEKPVSPYIILSIRTMYVRVRRANVASSGRNLLEGTLKNPLVTDH